MYIYICIFIYLPVPPQIMLYIHVHVYIYVYAFCIILSTSLYHTSPYILVAFYAPIALWSKLSCHKLGRGFHL